MKRHALILSLFVAISPVVCLAGIGFKFETAFTPPNLGSDIIMTAFTGAAGDPGSQVAIAGNKRIIVYNFKTNTVVKSVDYTARRLYGLVFADITRDRVPDLVYAYSAGGPKSQFVVVGVDGASGKADTLRFSSWVGHDFRATGGVIGAFDLNKDGFKELFVAADTGCFRNQAEIAFSQTRLYRSFPDSLTWKQLTPRILAAEYLPWGLTHPALWLETQTAYSCAPAHLGPDTSLVDRFLLPDGTLSQLNIVRASPCGQAHITDLLLRTKLETFRATGQYGPTTEMFTTVDRLYTCSGITDTVRQHALEMMMVHNAGTIEPVWSLELPSDYSDLITDPELPTFLFAFLADHSALSLLRISDGAFRSQVREVPRGHYRWDYPSADPSPRLIVTNGQELAIYRLTATSEDPDDGVNDLLPATFRIGRTYANPHQFGLVIPIDVPRSTRVTVEIFNVRGKRIKLLVDQPMPQGKQELTWDASDTGSGLYDIRATQGNVTVSTKVLLWR